MKKIAIVAAAIMAVIVAGIVFINIREADTEVTKKQTKVGVLLNGKKQDHSWGQTHYEGLEATARELNLDITYLEDVPENEACVESMEQLIAEGCKIIVCNSFGFGEYELQVAEKHPEIYFFHATGVQEATNLSTYFGRIYQMRYLSGIVAGLQTESNEIGYVAAYDIPEVNRGINAFTLGVREVNADANVYVRWSLCWNGDEETGETTNALLAAHPDIDVLAMHTDSLAVLEIAEEKGIWSIGYNIDNSEAYPNTFLTAPVWNWENFYEPRMLECLQDKFISKHYWEGVESGVIGLAPLTGNVKAGTAEKVEAARERLESGMFDVFYGPVVDNTGVVRVQDGESMSDSAMLNDFTWFVEGVIVEDEK